MSTRLRIIVTTLALCSVFAAALAAARQNPGAPPSAAGKIVIKTMYTEDSYSFAISPDGRTLVYQGTSPEGKRMLWRQAVDAAARPEPIEGTDGAGVNALPFFSPDGRSVAYFANGNLWQVDLAGGKPVELADAHSPNGGAWSKSGVMLVSVRGINGSIEKLQDGRLTAVTAPGLFVNPRFLDDQRFLVYARNIGGGGGSLQVGSLDGTALTARGLPALHAATFGAGHLFYATARGSLNAVRFDLQDLAVTGAPTVVAERVGKEDRFVGAATFTVSPGGAVAYREAAVVKRQMLWMNRAGDTLGSVGGPDDASPATPRVSPDGRFVLYFRQSGAPLGSVWMVEAATGQATMVRNGALSPAWAPGGDRILFTAVRGADVLLFEQPFNAASIAQQPARGRGAAAGQGRFVGPSTGVAVAEDISKSGFILYRAGFAGGGGNTGDLFAFPPAAAEPITIANSPAMERNARFSPDGNWIAYQSDETGRNEVYVQPFPGSALQRQRVSLSGGTSPQWGRAGGELYFLGADSRLMVVTVTRSGDAKQPAIQLATPKALINAALPPGSEYDTVDDGNRFLVMTSAEETPPIIVLPNWAAGKQ